MLGRPIGRFALIVGAVSGLATNSSSGSAQSGRARGEQEPLRLTYLANEGVMLSAGSRQLIIDGLFRFYGPEYALAPDSVRGSLESARPPYDGVDLLLVTHFHGDHFHPASVVSHLEANPGAALLTSRQVIDCMRGRFTERSGVAGRVYARQMRPHTRRRETVNGITVELLGLPHGGGRRNQRIEHLGYLVELGGHRVLHIGDADIDARHFEPFRLDTARIDVALVPHWMVLDEEGRRTIQRLIRPRRLVVFHVNEREAGESSRRVAEVWPGAVTLVQSLQHLTF